MEMTLKISREMMRYSPKIKQSPLPPTSANCENMNSNEQTEFVGDMKGTDLQHLFGGPGFDSTSPLNDMGLT